ncbi:hypothetical protein HY085_01540 [Candidatus Gottesmanbacteria bacterium]|nr:hypothetical protein [Candidatus Gottesmanbacteria bacterium]
MDFLVPLLATDLDQVSKKIAEDTNPRRRSDGWLNVLPEDGLPKRKRRKRTKAEVQAWWDFREWYNSRTFDDPT